MKYDVGNLGRGYLIALLLTMTILCLLALVVGTGRTALKVSGGIDPDELWRGIALMLCATLVLGATLWGVIRRQRWSYYLSLIICAYFVFTTVYSLARIDQSSTSLAVPVPKLVYAIFIVLFSLALGWLVLPSARAQFSPATHKR